MPVHRDFSGIPMNSTNTEPHVLLERLSALSTMCYADFCCQFEKSESASGGGVSFKIKYFKKGREFTKYFRPFWVIKTLSYNFRAPKANNTDKSLFLFFTPGGSRQKL